MDIDGYCAPRFSSVKDAFAANFAAGEELGARISLVEAGEVVVDLWGGHADRAGARPFDARTVTPIFSVTKALAGLLIARLVDAGALAYDRTVASVWPEFGQAGKKAITVEQVLSHQAGLCGFPHAIDIDEWSDWDAICGRLAAMAPLWPPATASGYHPITVGYLAGEIFRRVDGRTMPVALREDLGLPYGLDLWIGPPDDEARLAELDQAKGLPPFGDMHPATLAAIRPIWSLIMTRRFDGWLRGDSPAAHGHATALALARLMGALADDGRLAGGTILSPPRIAEASRARITGQDLVLPAEVSWAAGFMRNSAPNYYLGPGESAFGHAGWGGCCAFADPDRRLGGAYLMNRQGVNLVGDDRAGRAKRLFSAAYAAL